MRIYTLIILVLTSFLLSACTTTALVAGVATGGVIIYDHRGIQMVATDQKIIFETHTALKKNKEIQDRTHINMTSFNRVVLLTGQAPNTNLRNQVLQIVRKTPKIKKIYNYLTLQGPSSPLTRSSDTWVTTKIKSKMLATERLHSSQIKVLTENGHVYLLGEVTQVQADIAVNLARRVTGVQRVIKLFDYVETKE